MLFAMLIAVVLVAVTVVMHAAGLSLLIWSMTKSGAALPTQNWRVAWLLIRVAWVLILIHTSEVMVWALFYLSVGCLPNLESAFYFSGVTYATIGYGDLLLKEPWRFLAPFEGVTGILMCGLSASLFYVLGSRIYSSRLEAKKK
jgi:hypothetical protein